MTGRRALIIGNSDGIGLALTHRLLADGWQVTGVSRRPIGGAARHFVADVTGAGYRDVVAQASAGGVDLCVYAAGIGDLFDPADLAAQTRALEVNLIGAARTIEVVAPAMIAARSGHIIGLSSLADVAPSPQAPAYAASKAGLTSYLLGLRGALRPYDVAVSAIRFGFVDTKMAKSPVKPLLMPVEKAVDVIVDCLRTRRAVVSRPRRMAALMRVAAPLSRFSPPPRPGPAE
ncbi:SDR family NAD(P)-dependent oxidoreductase [Actinoplanes sp. CA-054009]